MRRGWLIFWSVFIGATLCMNITLAVVRFVSGDMGGGSYCAGLALVNLACLYAFWITRRAS